MAWLRCQYHPKHPYLPTPSCMKGDEDVCVRKMSKWEINLFRGFTVKYCNDC